LRLHHLPSGRADANSQTVKSLTSETATPAEWSWLNMRTIVGSAFQNALYPQMKAHTSVS